MVAVFDSKSKKREFFQSSETLIKELFKEEESAEMYLYYRGQDDMGEVVEEFQNELIS